MKNPSPGSLRRPDGAFRNVVPRHDMGLRKTLGLVWRMFTAKPPSTVPARPIPVRPLDAATLAQAPEASLFRLGHSTLLMKLDGGWWLTDPVFSERASPFSFAGPKRFHAPPLGIDELPPLRGVILSHDHYDHLDRDSIVALAPNAELIVAPLGVGDRLVKWGIDRAKIRQLDWWQETEAGGVRLAAVPAQHFSGRSLRDGDRTLWVSWVVLAGGLRLFFSGDTGYHAGFKAIGERYGPFDVTMLETGGYDRQWADVHMQPEQTLQAHLDLDGRWLLPIHNGTFDLAFHPWHEPLDRIQALAAAAGVPLATPPMGQVWALDRPREVPAWWRGFD
jgi:L-ascorbate metabolism protein UlaG (beta-lactamase superfamily)